MLFELLFLANLAQAETILVEGSGTTSIEVTVPDKQFKKLMRKIGGADDPIETVEVLSTSALGLGVPVIVEYSPGASGDPEFILKKEDIGRVEIGRIPGLKFEITGTGEMFSSGHTNNMFSSTRKFVIKNGRVVEVKQPYLYAGVKSTALADAVARSAPSKVSEIVFPIKKNEHYEIVLADLDENFFLVKDRRGLVGWVDLPKNQTPTLFKEIFYYGD